MASGAHLSSIDALNSLRGGLVTFIEQIGKAMIEADLEIQRVSEWIGKDRPAYWAAELKKRETEIAKAKDELRKVTLSITQHTPSAVEQKKALKKAQLRWEEAREKIAVCKRWRVQFDRAVHEYRGQAQHILSASEADLPKAVALLERLTADIDAYLAVQAPATDPALLAEPSGASAGSSMTMPVESQRKPAARKPVLPVKDCRVLRIRVPAAAQREHARLGSPYQDLPRRDESGSAPAAPLPARVAERVKSAGVSIRPGDLVVYESGAPRADRFFLLRGEAAGAGDSGWFAGLIEAAPIRSDLSSCTASRLAAAIPALKDALRLAPGYLVVMNRGEIELVLDREDQVVYDWNMASPGVAASGSVGESRP